MSQEAASAGATGSRDIPAPHGLPAGARFALASERCPAPGRTHSEHPYAARKRAPLRTLIASPARALCDVELKKKEPLRLGGAGALSSGNDASIARTPP